MKNYLVILKFSPVEGESTFDLENKQAYSVFELIKNLAVEFTGDNYEIVQITLIS